MTVRALARRHGTGSEIIVYNFAVMMRLPLSLERKDSYAAPDLSISKSNPRR